MTERLSNGTRPQLAFGDHKDIDDSDDRVVNTAVAFTGQRLRLVFDELLLGNNLEEIACADGTFSRVPEGTTPDDVAKCAGEIEALTKCEAVCIGSSGPVGILDEDDDLAADDFRMIAGTVTVTCDGTDIPWNDQQSFYQPSGNQLIGAGPLGVNALGPAIVVVPTDGLRSGSQCSVSLASDVVDKDGIQACADGGSGCNPGDVSAIKWNVEALGVTGTGPLNNATNIVPAVAGTGNQVVQLQFNAKIDADTIDGITLSDDTADFAVCADAGSTGCWTGAVNANDLTSVAFTVRGGFNPGDVHTVTVGTGVTDIFGGALPEAYTFSFTAATAQLISSVPADAATAVAVPATSSPGDSTMTFRFNTSIDAGTVDAITIADEAGAMTACAAPTDTDCYEVAVDTNATGVTLTVRGGFTPANQHVVSVPLTVAGTFGDALTVDGGYGTPLPAGTPDHLEITFTTADAAP